MGRNHISRFGQIRIYVGKCFRLFVTEKQWKNFISTLIIVALIAMVTGDDMFAEYNATRKGAFALVCACIWVGLFNSIQSICKERDIIKREHRSGVHISSYLIAHVIYELCICAVEAFIVLAVTLVRNASNLPDEGIFTLFPIDLYFAFLLIIFASDMMAILVSSGVKTEQMAMTIMPFILIIQLLMAGMVFELEGASKPVSTLTISRWGLDSICVISDAEELPVELKIEMPDNTPEQFMPTVEVAEGIEATPGNLALLFGRIILFSLVYIFIAILLLKRVDSDER